MKLRVQRDDHEVEEIDLAWPVSIVPANATLWRVKDADGIEHFFTEDGYYDGFGKVLGEEDRDLTNALEDYLNGRTKSDSEVRRILTNPTVH